jgi:hypothetical protein
VKLTLAGVAECPSGDLIKGPRVSFICRQKFCFIEMSAFSDGGPGSRQLRDKFWR